MDTTGDTNIIVKQNGKTRLIESKDVIYIESFGRKAFLHLANEVIEYYAKISQLETQLQPDFFRVHRAYLVNLDYVENYTKREAKMSNQDFVLISKYRFHDFQNAMRKYAKNTCKTTVKGLKCSKYKK